MTVLFKKEVWDDNDFELGVANYVCGIYGVATVATAFGDGDLQARHPCFSGWFDNCRNGCPK
jgi:hypothetical protein